MLINSKEIFFEGKMSLKFHFEVLLYRWVLFVMRIVCYFGDQNRRFPWAAASKVISL